MPNLFAYFTTAYEECLETCVLLKECLLEERRALIALDTELIVQTNLRKEGLTSSLRRRHLSLREIAKVQFGCDDLTRLGDKLEPREAVVWECMRDQWKEMWDDVAAQCQQNQKFIKHSMKNLGVIIDSLKRLFGNHSVYSASGKRVDASGEGRVVEARY